MTDDGYSDVNYKSICCEQIPDIFLDKLVAKNHFSKFGKINRFILRPKRLSCTVEYENELDAENAFESAGNYNGYEFPIRFAEREVGHVQNTEEWVDADVQAELDAMGSGLNQPRSLNMEMMTKPALSLTPKTSWQKSTVKPQLDKDLSPVQAPKKDSALCAELEAILRQPAHTAEEKYRVLDARDKLMRLTTKKQTDIAKAQRRTGICPDMCPEKERLMRDFQRQVAVFETTKSSMLGSISHRRAIKEYSRSSADQEVPLLHELRSESVLKMTMLYLMHRIMDQVENPQVNKSDWYHFVWDRTRSIRKDITQQELCSLEAVELVEQCARFHIHCAARLVAEDPSVFDKKINAENLTKCLQTLKYLYHDLRLKNIPCPHEAEFRSYIVLLNLGNSNFLWEIKQLPEHIQKSPEIKRAMAFSNVLQTNNYVRFFNMVSQAETSYLSACILLGYFTKLRIRAMDAILKSHNWRKNSVYIRLSDLTRILGFEDENAAANFFQYHGLLCDEERGVLLSKLQPATDYCMERSLNLVESKCMVSVGECICGHPLESPNIFENHQPHNSFDDNGFLRPEAWTAEDQLRGEAALRVFKDKKLKVEEENQQQQRRSTPPNAMTNTQKEDRNIFKVPQVTPQTLPKHFMQQPQKPIHPTVPILGVPSQQNISNNLFNSTAPKSSNLFNIPSSSASTASNNIFQTKVANSSKNNSLFTSVSATENIFDKNIFGGISKPKELSESNNIFQKPTEPKLLEPSDNSVFKYFQPTFQGFGEVADVKNSSIFEDPSAEFARKKSMNADKEEEARKQAAAAEEAKRQMELEKEKKRQLEQAEEQRKVEEAAVAARLAAERDFLLKKLHNRAEKETEELLRCAIHEQIEKVAEAELALFKLLDRKTSELTEELLQEMVEEEVKEITLKEHSIICHDRMLLERYFAIWIKRTRKKVEQRQALESTPLWVTADTAEALQEQLEHPSLKENIKMIKRYRHGEACDFKTLLWDEDIDLRWRNSIDICSMVSTYLARRTPLKKIQQRHYFKLLFTLPGEMDEICGFGNLCGKLLQTVLRFPNSDQITKSKAFLCTLQENVALCVRKAIGVPPVNESGQRACGSECDNVDGIVCFMTCSDLASTRKRIHYILQHSKNYKRLPMAFLVYGNEFSAQDLISLLKLKDFVEHSKIGVMKFFNWPKHTTDYIFKTNLENALWHLIHSNFNPKARLDNLEMQTTQSWLETCLGEEMWRRWQASALQNPAFCKICSMLPHVIGLYNAAVERLRRMLPDHPEIAPEFPNELRQFVPEIDGANRQPMGLEYFSVEWKSSAKTQSLLKFLDDITLPAIEKEPPVDVEKLKIWLLDYASQCIVSDDEKSASAAFFAIKALIEQLTSPSLQTLEIQQRMTLISYLPVVKNLVFAVINDRLQSSYSDCLPHEAIYQRQQFLDYLEKPWWLNYEAVRAVTVDYTLQDENTLLQEDFFPESQEDVDAVLKKAAEVSKYFEEKNRKSEKHLLTNSNLDCSLLERLDQTLKDFEAAKASIINPLQVSTRKKKHATSLKETSNPRELYRENKRKRVNNEPAVETDDVLAKAFALIEKIDASRDLDYATTRLKL